MDREILEFLFLGPLYSIFKVLTKIEREMMTLKEQLQAYNARLSTITEELRSDFQRLNDKIASTPAAEDVSAELAALDSSIGNLEGLDQPNPEPEPAPVEEPPAESPGEPPAEPASVETPSETTETPPENV